MTSALTIAAPARAMQAPPARAMPRVEANLDDPPLPAPLRIINGILDPAMRAARAIVLSPARSVTAGLALLSGLQGVRAGVCGRHHAVAARSPHAAGAAAAGDVSADLEAIGRPFAKCMQVRHVPGLDRRDTEAHCLGEVAHARATGRPLEPDVFRELARSDVAPGSSAGRYKALMDRAMHRQVTLRDAKTVEENIAGAARLAVQSRNVLDRIHRHAAALVDRCGLHERVDNNDLGVGGLFIRADVEQVLDSEACADSTLPMPTELELRRANAAQYYQSGRVADERAFRQGQYGLHEGRGNAAARAASRDAVVTRIIDVIGL